MHRKKILFVTLAISISCAVGSVAYAAALLSGDTQYVPKELLNESISTADRTEPIASNYESDIRAFSTEIINVHMGQSRYAIPRNFISLTNGLKKEGNQFSTESIGLEIEFPKVSGRTPENMQCFRRRLSCPNFVGISITETDAFSAEQLWKNMEFQVVGRAPEFDDLAPQLIAYKSKRPPLYSGQQWVFLRPERFENNLPVFECLFDFRQQSKSSGHCDAYVLPNPWGQGRHRVQFNREQLREWPQLLRSVDTLITSFERTW